jgi:hypothetical protein
MKPAVAIALSLATIYVWLSTASTSCSLIRIFLHWMRKPIAIWTQSEKFWKTFGKVEETLAYFSLALAKFGRKESVDLLLAEAQEEPPENNQR